MSSRLTLLPLAATAVACLLPLAAGAATLPEVGVGAQYDTTHVYVAPDKVDPFAASFLATFGGASTRQVVATVTPTPSSTTSQLLQTPVGTVSLFGYTTPVPYAFGLERTGYLVTDMDKALAAARRAGASVVVDAFPDPIGRDAVIEWPGGVHMQLYWHTAVPHYAAFETVPENRVYVPPEAVTAFVRDWLGFSHGKLLSDVRSADGAEIGRPGETFRRIAITSVFGRMTVFVTNGHLPWPHGLELTGYEVADLGATLARATSSGARIVADPVTVAGRSSAMVEFPGGYVAEIHAAAGH